ncbi:AfsR/SARP family transcriptional regulator [Longispora albida]|uniref:AfsR/SARP family transcriptional regulator n=1 Tax=Longispora albida TaxID=203523 RepID=UPI00036DE981|nr:BTAD domain-containing putative transcriptional regulator [Longispora albida]
MEFRVLGGVELVDGDVVTALGNRRIERCVLGVLLLGIGGPVSADRLIDLIWGEDLPGQPRAAIQVAVSRLRAQLTAAGADRSGVAIVSQSSGYLLTGSPEQVDALRFRAMYQESRRLSDPAERRALLGSALALWRGPVLGTGATEPIKQRIWPEFDELLLTATEDRIAADLDLGRHSDVVGELFVLTAEHPLRARLTEQLMISLYRTGRQPEALATARAFRTALAEEHGLDPGPEFVRLEQQILRDELGTGTPEPQPSPAPSPVPNQVPPSSADFTGRVAALSWLDGLLPSVQDGTAPVVISAIDGSGGVGKTALAIHWAHQAREHFPGGQLHINLHGFSMITPVTPLEALGRFLRALGVPPQRVPDGLDEAAAQFRELTTGRRMLIVLDNVGGAEQVRPLLTAGPGNLTLITSRNRLAGLIAIDGAQRLTLGLLTPEESAALLARMLGEDRVAAEAEAAGEIARLCGYLPLAIRITGALLADLPERDLAGYAAELAGSDRLLALDIEDDPAASVRAAFERSYAILSPEAARMFRLCGVFPGPDITAGALAAAAGAGEDQAAEILDQLATAHLVEETVPGRYAPHDLLRLYAAELAAEDEGSLAARERLVSWYLHATHTAARILNSQLILPPLPEPVAGLTLPDLGGLPEAMAWYEAERPNLAAALLHLVNENQHDLVHVLNEVVRPYLFRSLSFEDWELTSQAALRSAQASGNQTAIAEAHNSLAQLRYSRAKYAEAIEHYAPALVAARQSGNPATEGFVLLGYANAHLVYGQLGQARQYYLEGVTAWQAAGSRHYETVHWDNMALASTLLGNLDEAVAGFESALAWYQEIGAEGREAHCRSNLATTLIYRGDYELAAEHLSQAVGAQAAQATQRGEAMTRHSLAMAYAGLGRLSEARTQAELALTIATESQNGYTKAEALATLGMLDLSEGDPAAASTVLDQALAVAREAGVAVSEARTLTLISEARTALGDHPGAVTAAKEALAIITTTGYRVLEPAAQAALAAAS